MTLGERGEPVRVGCGHHLQRLTDLCGQPLQRLARLVALAPQVVDLRPDGRELRSGVGGGGSVLRLCAAEQFVGVPPGPRAQLLPAARAASRIAVTLASRASASSRASVTIRSASSIPAAVIACASSDASRSIWPSRSETGPDTDRRGACRAISSWAVQAPYRVSR